MGDDRPMNQRPTARRAIISRSGLAAIAGTIVGVPVIFVLSVLIHREVNAVGPFAVAAPSGSVVVNAPMPRVTRPVVTSIAPRNAALQALRDVNGFGAALTLAKLGMSDSNEEVSDGAVWLGMWLDSKGSWPDVEPSHDETSVGKVKKNSDAERGKRLCARGRVIQIKREGSGDVELYTGNIVTEAGNVVNFIAAWSTGELVEDSYARFCGVVAGNYSFANVSGGQTQSVQMVGAFDLPENHPKIGRRVAGVSAL